MCQCYPSTSQAHTTVQQNLIVNGCPSLMLLQYSFQHNLSSAAHVGCNLKGLRWQASGPRSPPLGRPPRSRPLPTFTGQRLWYDIRTEDLTLYQQHLPFWHRWKLAFHWLVQVKSSRHMLHRLDFSLSLAKTAGLEPAPLSYSCMYQGVTQACTVTDSVRKSWNGSAR